MEKKLTMRRRQALETKSRIYAVAVQLIEQKGYDNIAIEQICSKADVSVGAFYHHFSSKSDILLEIFKAGDTYFREKVVGKLSGDTVVEQILSYFDHFALFYHSVGVDHIKALYKTQSELFLNQDRFMITVLRDLIDQGSAKRELTPSLDGAEITDFLLSAARGVAYTWCLHHGHYPLQEALHRYLAYLLRSLTA